MREDMEAGLTLTRDDLFASMRFVDMRADGPEAEQARLLIVRRLLAASFELTRSLQAQTQCALVNHCGTRGTRSLAEATGVFVDALEEYAARCRDAALAARRSEEELGIRTWKDARSVVRTAAVG